MECIRSYSSKALTKGLADQLRMTWQQQICEATGNQMTTLSQMFLEVTLLFLVQQGGRNTGSWTSACA